jgi:hypothetical protein
MVHGPDLSMRVRIACAHHRPAILEDLHVPGSLALLVDGLRRPGIDHLPYLASRHLSQVAIVSLREHHDAARAASGNGSEKGVRSFFRDGLSRRRRGESRVVVVEEIHSPVIGIPIPSGAGVSRAEIAAGIVGSDGPARGFIALAEPRPVQAAGRAQHPIARERVPATVRVSHDRA